jgi:phosphopantothenoylcysteine synthetase/decarboxylase
MTGAIQTATFFPFLYALRSAFCRELKIALTKSASKFVRRRALVHQFDCEVYCGTFQHDSTISRVPHIALSQWASCVLVAPATAATIYRIAHATCNDLVSLTITAMSANVPVIIGPSMNGKMWLNPAVQQNVLLCRKRGYWFIEPGVGVEVNVEWNKRAPCLGPFAAQPSGLIRVMSAVHGMQKPAMGDDAKHTP